MPVYAVIVLLSLWLATFSVGTFHADEHFQVLEWASSILHSTNPSVWEFKHQIRPTLQPTLVAGLLLVLNSFGLDEPAVQTWILRFLSSAFFLFCLNFFLQKLWDTQGAGFKKVHFYSFFFYLIALMAPRYSSESLSSAFSLLFLGMLITKYALPLKLFSAALFMVFAFQTRYQSVLFTLPFLISYLALNKNLVSFKNASTYLGGIILAFVVGVACDFYSYKSYTFTPWNYFKVNVLEGKASSFGVEPWYHYIKASIFSGWLPANIVLFLGLYLFWKMHKDKHKVFIPILVGSFVFFFVHSLIGHKENRFVFYLAPMLVPFSFALWEKVSSTSRSKKIILNTMYCLPLLLVMWVPLNSEYPFALKFRELYQEHSGTVVYVNKYEPFKYGGLQMQYFKPDGYQQMYSKERDLSQVTDAEYFVYTADIGSWDFAESHSCSRELSFYQNYLNNEFVVKALQLKEPAAVYLCK